MKVYASTLLNEHDLQKIKDAFPTYEYIVCKNFSQEDIDQADIIIGNPSISLDLKKEHLKAIMLNSAGSDQYCKEGLIHEKTKLVNASGTYGTAISEQVIGMILALTKNLKAYGLQMKQHQWNQIFTGKEIYHSKVCIVGFGDIGYETAKRLKAFDCHITAVKRRMDESLSFVDRCVTMEKLDEVLADSDYVILALPQNASTIHLFDKEKLLKMKKDAILVNVGRGSAIVTKDLEEVLASGHLYGVALDVTEPEPLGEESKLWDMENVLITPHSSGGFVWTSVHDHFVEIVISNMKHLEKGEELENEVDVTTGYRKKVIYRQ